VKICKENKTIFSQDIPVIISIGLFTKLIPQYIWTITIKSDEAEEETEEETEETSDELELYDNPAFWYDKKFN